MDVYNAGLVLYEMLTKHGLVRETDMNDVLQQITEEAPPRPSQVAPNVDIAPELDAICLHALAKSPADRYDSMAKLIEDLQAFRHDQPVSVYRADTSTRLRRWKQAHIVAIVAITSALVAATLTALIMANI